MVGQWFVRSIDTAMAIYSIVMSIGFMIAFPVVGSLVQSWGWRSAWLAIGVALIVVLAPLSLLVRQARSTGITLTQQYDARLTHRRRLRNAGRKRSSTPAFWIFAIGAALYGLVASGIGLFNESILAERGFGPDVYYQTLIVTAMTALTGNFGGGWLAMRMSLPNAAGDLAVRAGRRPRRAAARDDDRAGDGVGHRDGPRRRPGDGAVLQRLAARLRPRASRPHPRRGAGDDGARLGGRPAAARLVHRMDRQLRGHVQLLAAVIGAVAACRHHAAA